jgi:hypothetical protein
MWVPDRHLQENSQRLGNRVLEPRRPLMPHGVRASLIGDGATQETADAWIARPFRATIIRRLP